jgi:hypothetical protein
MIRIASLLSLATIVCLVSVATAEEKAATSKLPAALQALGSAQGQVVTKEAASRVRGQGCVIVPRHPTFTQVNQITIQGEGTVEVTKIVGLVGQAVATGGGGTIQAQFGGMTGTVAAGTDHHGAAAISWNISGAGAIEHATITGTGTFVFSNVFTSGH